jgi:hypothetical protein
VNRKWKKSIAWVPLCSTLWEVQPVVHGRGSFRFWSLLFYSSYTAASLGASEDAIPTGENLVILPQGDFVYQPQPNKPYPSCRLTKGLEIPGSDLTALIDYAFLAEVVYQSPKALSRLANMLQYCSYNCR